MQYVICKYRPGDVNSLPLFRISEEGAEEESLVISAHSKCFSKHFIWHLPGTQSDDRPLSQPRSRPAAVGSHIEL